MGKLSKDEKEQPEAVNIIVPEKLEKKEEIKSMNTTPSDYSGLFSKISSMSGKEKEIFCRNLSIQEKKAYISYLREKDTTMVTGTFRCFEPIGGSVKFTAMAFEGESPMTYEFKDGETYTVPMYIVRRMEKEFQGSGTHYHTHAHILDANGNPIVGTGKVNRRFGFNTGIY